MPTSRQHIEACLTKIRSAGMNPAKAASTPEGFQLHVAVWLERLARYDPRAVSAAFENWIDSQDEWPLPKGLLPLVEVEQAKLDLRPTIARHHVERQPKPPATPDEIRTTAKLVFDIEATPESFVAGKALAKIGRELIRRHIANGTCPPDVAGFFPPEAEPAP